jgi:hypothetical protein
MCEGIEGALIGMTGPTPPWRSMFWRMLEKKAGAPGVVERPVVVRVKRGDSLHSRARRVVASTPASFVVMELERKRGVEGDDGGDFKFVNGEESINDGVSVKAANPPIIRFSISGGMGTY